MEDKSKKKKYRIALSFVLIIVLCSVYLIIPVSKAFAFKARHGIGIRNRQSSNSRVLTLKEAYILAARRNGTIMADKESYYQSTLLKWSAISMLLPNINLTYKDQRFHLHEPAPVPSTSGSSNTAFHCLQPFLHILTTLTPDYFYKPKKYIFLTKPF